MRRIGLLVLMLGVGLLLALWGDAVPNRSEANTGAGTMNFRVVSGSRDCMPTAKPAKCTVMAGTAFKLAVAVNDFPGDYTVMYSEINFGSLVYKPTAQAADEVVWPDSSGFIVREMGAGFVRLLDATGLGAPPSTYKGNVVEILINCTAGTSTNVIELVPYDPVDHPAASLLQSSQGALVPTQDSMTINCVAKLPDPGDTDGDDCSDQRENGADPMLGGQRNFLDFWDFYDVWTRPDPVGQPNLWTRDKAVTIPGDILGTAERFGATRPGGAPDETTALAEALAPPTSTTGYHTDFDRGRLVGPNPWDLGPPDGAISLPVDILGVAKQFGHSCM